MNERIYIRAAAQIGGGIPDPDFRQFLTPMEARRMGNMMKRAVATSTTVLSEAGVEHPDAIVTGTWFGSVECTEALLLSLKGVSGQPLKPTHFMQSTHNTVSSLIGIRTGSHGYNATYSHGRTSFESALFDAMLQIRLGEISNALVGAFDEMTPTFAAMLSKAGIVCPDIASSFLLTTDPSDALCEICDVSFDGAAEGAELTLQAPFGYFEAVKKIAGGEAASVLVSNHGARGNNTDVILKKI